MKTFNHVQLVGYLGRDPEFLKLKSGAQLARLSLATNQPRKKREGERFTDWHKVILWDPEHIEKIKNTLIKGSHVLIDGRVIYSRYKNKEGQQRSSTEIRANYLIDLDR